MKHLACLKMVDFPESPAPWPKRKGEKTRLETNIQRDNLNMHACCKNNTD